MINKAAAWIPLALVVLLLAATVNSGKYKSSSSGSKNTGHRQTYPSQRVTQSYTQRQTHAQTRPTTTARPWTTARTTTARQTYTTARQHQYTTARQQQYTTARQQQYTSARQQQYTTARQNLYTTAKPMWSAGQSQYPSQKQNQYPTQHAQNPNQALSYPTQGQSRPGQYPAQGQSHYPAQGQSHYPAQGQSHYPTQGQSHYPTQVQNRPVQGPSHYPVQPQSHYPVQGQSHYPVQGQSHYPVQGPAYYPPQGQGMYMGPGHYPQQSHGYMGQGQYPSQGFMGGMGQYPSQSSSPGLGSRLGQGLATGVGLGVGMGVGQGIVNSLTGRGFGGSRYNSHSNSNTNTNVHTEKVIEHHTTNVTYINTGGQVVQNPDQNQNVGQNPDQGPSQNQGQYQNQGPSQNQGQYPNQGPSQTQGQYPNQGPSQTQGQYPNQGPTQTQGQNVNMDPSQPQGQNANLGQSQAQGQNATAGPSQDTAPYDMSKDPRVLTAIATSQFSLDLFKSISKSSPGNIVMSPMSVQMLLSMLQQGARNSSSEQLEEVVHLQPEISKAGYSFCIKGYENYASRLHIANRIFVHPEYDILPEYASDLVTNFNSAPEKMATTGYETAAKINDWIKLNSKDQIKQVVKPEEITSDTKMMLANVIRFKAEWLRSFAVAKTAVEEFHTTADSSVNVTMMNQAGLFASAMDDTLKAQWIVMPYDGYVFSMIVVLPTEPHGLDKVIENITPQHLNFMMNTYYFKHVTVKMPRFHLNGANSLKSTLQKFNLTDVFDENSHLEGISLKSPLAVSEILHNAMIEVTEEGTEAPGVSTLYVRDISDTPTYELLDFNATQPFLAIIIDNISKMPLFMGRVSNPESLS